MYIKNTNISQCNRDVNEESNGAKEQDQIHFDQQIMSGSKKITKDFSII